VPARLRLDPFEAILLQKDSSNGQTTVLQIGFLLQELREHAAGASDDSDRVADGAKDVA